MEEQWKTIQKYPDYAVSNLGRIKRLTSRTCAKAGAILKTPGRSKKRPYLSVDLCHPGGKTTELVHRLVALAFLGDPPFPGAEVNHIDADKRNAAASNLEWITSSANQHHSYESGLQSAKGESNGRAKLTELEVLEMRELAATGICASSLGERYGVHKRTALGVISRESWTHI
ncbi:NUMOD4 motif-containing HNH endonuclease [Pseudomonas capsici]|uniref:NUMOD4 motif-containing HNH endonuclease n=1 Tax=Pseudomonas capsici TaxID=2810614 RepID=UPI0021F0A495|nr:NUMOD4 motif-containing HNH endonuclease [Pseudomonas capsici]MCV4287880.1 NUMOD4 motif-containing HNH endonuclease [Pseudomonas capsici]